VTTLPSISTMREKYFRTGIHSGGICGGLNLST